MITCNTLVVAITKYTQSEWFKEEKFIFSLSSGDWNSKPGVPAWSVSDETLPLWFWVPSFNVCLHDLFGAYECGREKENSDVPYKEN